jgi:hypothetical protein
MIDEHKELTTEFTEITGIPWPRKGSVVSVVNLRSEI